MTDATRSPQGTTGGTNDETTKNLALALSVERAAELAGVSRSTLYGAMRCGDLRARKAGSRTLLLLDDLRKWLDALPAFQSADADQGGDA